MLGLKLNHVNKRGPRQAVNIMAIEYGSAKQLQWNLSVTTTSILKSISSDLFSNMFNEDWRYQLTLANNSCLLELI